jgi:putative transposase
VPQSLAKLYVHVVFSTKDREPWIDGAIRDRMHAYLASVVRDAGSPWVVVGGVEDHVHLLFDLGRTDAIADFVEKIKRESSKFAKTLGDRYAPFTWQRGYGAFSVSPTLRGEAEAYVRNQEEHHRRQSFQEEYRAFLQRYGIEFDERYLWD